MPEKQALIQALADESRAIQSALKEAGYYAHIIKFHACDNGPPNVMIEANPLCKCKEIHISMDGVSESFM
jgi:hypothetical protein